MLKLEYFPIKKVFPKTANNNKITYFKIIMSEISTDLKNLFLSHKTAHFESWSRIFFRLKIFSLYSKIQKSTYLILIMSETSANLKNILGSLRCSGARALGRDIRWTRFRSTRLQHRTCKASRGHFASHDLCAHGFSTERARLAGGTSLRSWFQKKASYLLGFHFFSFENTPDFESWSWNIFRSKKFFAKRLNTANYLFSN